MRAYAYARFSSDNQREESIDAQLRAIREYADRNGIMIVHDFVDEARSATTDKRPAFQEMFGSLKDIDAIIVHKLDRFSRDRYDSAFYKRELKKRNVRLISVLEPLDDSPESVILESVLEGMAEYYSRNLARETMKGLKETAYQCRHTGGMPPLGYDVVNGYYVVNEDEAKIVQLIFDKYAAGEKYESILRALEPYRTKWGLPFTKTSLNSILRNEKYIGTYVFGRQSRKLHNSHKDSDDIIRIPDGIPRIIDNDTWIVAQERVRSHRRNPAYTAKRTYILSGKLECSCGTIMTGAASVNEKGSYRYYRCRHCRKSVNADQVEREVLARISDRMHFTRADAVSIRRVLEREQTADMTLKTELRNVQKQISNILEAIQQGIFHPQLKSNLDALMEKEKEIQQQMSFSDVPSVESIMTFLESISDVSAYDVEKQADIVKRLIEKIKIVGTQFDIEFRLSLVAGDRTLSWYKYTVRL